VYRDDLEDDWAALAIAGKFSRAPLSVPAV